MPVDVAVEAKLSADGKKVTAQAGITSTRAMSNAGYKVEFVLVGNGMSGTGNGWVQENYYNNATADIFPEPEFAPFLGTTDKVAGLDYDDVVLATTRTLGTDVALPNALEAYKPCQAAATFELDAIVTPDKLNPVKFNKTKLDVVPCSSMWLPTRWLMPALRQLTPQTIARLWASLPPLVPNPSNPPSTTTLAAAVQVLLPRGCS